jgi:hypothetical protein
MNTITFSSEDWRAVIAVPREKRPDSMVERADRLEQQTEQHGPDQATVILNLAEDMFLRSFNQKLLYERTWISSVRWSA